MNDTIKQLIESNLKEIIRAAPNTYEAYVAETTLKAIQNDWTAEDQEEQDYFDRWPDIEPIDERIY